MGWFGNRAANGLRLSRGSVLGIVRTAGFALAVAGLAALSTTATWAAEDGKGPTILSPEGPGLLLPNMNAERGRQLAGLLHLHRRHGQRHRQRHRARCGRQRLCGRHQLLRRFPHRQRLSGFTERQR